MGKVPTLSILFGALFLFSGCFPTVIRGEKGPDTSLINIGTSKVEFEASFGEPIDIVMVDGCEINIYEYIPGQSIKIESFLTNAMTFGGWDEHQKKQEEYRKKQRSRISIVYNKNDRIRNIGNCNSQQKNDAPSFPPE